MNNVYNNKDKSWIIGLILCIIIVILIVGAIYKTRVLPPKEAKPEQKEEKNEETKAEEKEETLKQEKNLSFNIEQGKEFIVSETIDLIVYQEKNGKKEKVNVTYSSTNPNVVSVENNKLIAKAPGTTIITATTKEGYKKSINIVIKEKDFLTLNVVNKYEMNLNDKFTLVAYRNHNKNQTLETVTWSSSNSSVAKIDSNGTITAIKKGKTTIIAKTKDNLSATIEINVVDKPYLSLNTTSPKNMEIKTTHQLKAYRNYKGTKSEEVVVWSSSNSNLVSVSSTGLLYAHETGTVTITATSSDGLKQTIQIKVTATPTVTINECSANSLNLKIGESKQLTYTSSKPISGKATWSSSKTNVATITSTGKVTAKEDGMTTITVSVGGFTKTCSLVVHTTYTSSISKTSTTSYNNIITEKLTVTTKDHNNNIITDGLTYKWYLNDAQITSATSKTLSIKEYGTYKVEVYKNNSKKTSTTYTPSANSIFYTIDTSKDTKFVFVNNPEPIDENDFVDKGKVIYKTSFDKNMEMYFEHNRDTSTPFYYGIRIYNPNSQNVNLTINNSGVSALYGGGQYYDKVWEEYYTGNVVYHYNSENKKYNFKESYTLSPGQYLYLWLVQDLTMKGKVKFVSTISNYKYAPYNTYLPSDVVPVNNTWSWAFDGVLNITARVTNGNYVSSIGGKLEVSNIAVSKNFYKAENKEAINTASTLATKKHGQLTGEYNGKPVVTNNAKFVINDDTPAGTLPTYYSTTSNSSKKSLMSGWITNLSGSSTTAYQRETIPLKGINTSGAAYTVTPFGSITTANYAVHYKENITIVNNSSKSRSVAFYINSGSGTETTSANTTLISFVTNSNNGVVKSSYKTNNVTIYPTATFGIFSKRTNIQIWKATIPAKTAITVPSITLVGGMSYANIVKMVCVDNTCYDAFYQKNFTW